MTVRFVLWCRKGMLALLLSAAAYGATRAQAGGVTFTSSDTALQRAFERAKAMALSYRGAAADVVGPWYEAALPSRNAFCIRDASHQSIAADILGMGAENKNMLTHFVSNISEAKDWCTYWEMNKTGGPAPEDYRNDREFWYNLNANFELIHTSWRLYLWTGDSIYITSPAFTTFFDRTLGDYIQRWTLQPDSLLKRPPYPNAPQPFNFNDYFHRCRGLPSYFEAISDMQMGADLVAAIYRGISSYAAIAAWSGDQAKADSCRRLAETYRRHLETHWWDASANRYNTYYTNKGAFGKGEGEAYLLWYDALTDSARTRRTVEHLVGNQWNVENLSYFPLQLSRLGYFPEAYRYILYLTDPATKRREYPEVSFGVMEGIVQGLMGISADARQGLLTTIYNSHSRHSSEISNLKVLSSSIRLKHHAGGSTLTNEGRRQLTWCAAFHGRVPFARVNGEKIKTTVQTDFLGNTRSHVVISVPPGREITAALP